MIKYTIFQKNPASHYVYFTMEFETKGAATIQMQLSAWRPGRYELGNFAKNIKKLEAFDANGVALKHTKLNKDLWEIETHGASNIKVTYSYYSAELNAGACYADVEQIYLNPVHCCFYIVGRENENYELHLETPHDYKIACSLKKNGSILYAANYDELAESPLIASAKLQTESYEVKSVKFYLHFNGDCKPNFEKIKQDFIKFTEYQLKFWGSFPFDEYHFLFQITPFKFYHGVEHFKNTVIALGPGYELNNGKMYEDLLGVSCHELFHVWNIKTIRPLEMLPYNYTRENYAITGFVYEGFTTYYGDKNLYSSGAFELGQYFETLEERLDKHFNNYGRFNLSVAESSWDTWLDGYVPGAPYRKTNIYDEGSLIAFMLDVMIMEATDNTRSLKDVCVELYQNFGKKGVGYSYNDIVNLCSKYSGKDLAAFFNSYVKSASDFEEALVPCFRYLGLELKKIDNPLLNERLFGFKTIDNGTFAKVSLVAPYSPAWKAGLFANDDIIAVNGMVVRNNLNALLNYHSESNGIELTVISNERIKRFDLATDSNTRSYFFKSTIVQDLNASQRQKENFELWKAN